MSAKNMVKPRFIKGQMVEFLGGVGTIINSKPESGSWSYFVQMEMGPEPEMGRIGYETTILLVETDITITDACLVAA